MTAAQIQNALVLCIILGFATMEYVSRRYKQTVHATGNDTKLELLMFLSVLAVTQPLAIFVTAKLGSLWVPQYKGVLADMPWWGMVGVLLVLDDMRSIGGIASRTLRSCGPCTVRTTLPST